MALTQANKMTVAAHRGDSYNYYENTMTAFRMAVQNGAQSSLLCAPFFYTSR